MKICTKCKLEKPIEEFRKRGKTKQGRCKQCAKEYDKLWHAAYKNSRNSVKLTSRKLRSIPINDVINKVKSNPCKDCGQTFIPFAMDFDHISDKINCVSVMRNGSYSLDRVLREISKCDLLCAVCHRIRTYNRLTKPS